MADYLSYILAWPTGESHRIECVNMDAWFVRHLSTRRDGSLYLDGLKSNQEKSTRSSAKPMTLSHPWYQTRNVSSSAVLFHPSMKTTRGVSPRFAQTDEFVSHRSQSSSGENSGSSLLARIFVGSPPSRIAHPRLYCKFQPGFGLGMDVCRAEL